MIRQLGRGRIIFLTGLAALALLFLAFWMIPETPPPEAPSASIAAGPPERAPEPAPPPAAAPASPPPGPSTEPFTQPWLEIPSLEKREARAELSPAEARAREMIEGYPAVRAAILAELEGQTLEETIALARGVWPHDAFAGLYPRGPLLNDRQKYLLQDPRLARILHAAVHGDEAGREAILQNVMVVIGEIMDKREKRPNGLPIDETLVGDGPGIEIYPLVLSEVDTAGVSLPLLLEWFDLERGPERSEDEIRALHEKMGIEPRPGAKVLPPVAGHTLLIATAAQRITERMGEPLHEGGTIHDPFDNKGGPRFPGGMWGVQVVDELAGYELLEVLLPFEIHPLMDTLRARLAGRH